MLISGLGLPEDGAYDYNLTIRSDGKVEGWQQVGERIVRINSWAVGAKAIPTREELFGVFEKKCSDYADDAFDKESAIEAFGDTLIEVGAWTY